MNGDNDASTGHRPGPANGTRIAGPALDGVFYAVVRHRIGTDIGLKIPGPALNGDNDAATGHRPGTVNGSRITGPALDGVFYAEVRRRIGTDIGSRISGPA